jgi:hypothetical protein
MQLVIKQYPGSIAKSPPGIRGDREIEMPPPPREKGEDI